MTAYLQPGDKIHIAFPLSANVGETLPEASRRMHAELVAMYAQMNIELIGSSGNTTLNHPVIVAVIRESKPLPPLPNHWKVPWQDPPEATERPRAKEFLPHGFPPE